MKLSSAPLVSRLERFHCNTIQRHKKQFLMHYSDAETPVYVLAIPFGPTAIHVIWATVQPLRKTVGYRIHYSGPTNGSEDVDGPDTKNFVLTGLKNNGTYCVAIAVKRYHSSIHTYTHTHTHTQNPLTQHMLCL